MGCVSTTIELIGFNVKIEAFGDGAYTILMLFTHNFPNSVSYELCASSWGVWPHLVCVHKYTIVFVGFMEGMVAISVALSFLWMPRLAITGVLSPLLHLCVMTCACILRVTISYYGLIIYATLFNDI